MQTGAYQNFSVANSLLDVLDALGLPVLKVVRTGETANVIQKVVHHLVTVGSQVNL